MKRLMEIVAGDERVPWPGPVGMGMGMGMDRLFEIIVEQEDVSSQFWYWAKKYGEEGKFKGKDLTAAEMKSKITAWKQRSEHEKEAKGGVAIHRKYTAGFSSLWR